jgi:phage FluMu protein Com
MPTLACRICGRVVYTAAAFETLFAEESRCPRCGAVLWPERRTANRRKFERRENPPDDPGPPSGIERRGSDRRGADRRRDSNRTLGS